MPRKPLTLIFTLCGILGLSRAAESSGWTMEESINRALQQNPLIRQAALEQQKASGAIIEARAVLYPTVETSLSGGMKNNDLFGSQDDKDSSFREDWRVALRITYSLLSAGVNTNNIELANIAKNRSFLAYQQTVNDVVHQVRQAYLKILFYSGESQIQREIIKLLEDETSRQKSLFDAGRTTRFNILRTEVRLANERPAFHRAENNLLAAGTDLANLIGLPWPGTAGTSPLKIAGALETPSVQLSLEQAIALARQQRPDAQLLAIDIRSEELNYKNAKATNVPRLDAFTSTTARRDNDAGSGFFDGNSEVAFGVLGRWDVFDGFTGRGKAMQADARRQQLEIRRDDFDRTLELEVRKAHTALVQAAKTLNSQRDNVGKAEESIRLARSSVEAGYGTQLDILQATVDLNEARTNELRARFQYAAALTDLEKVLFFRNGNITVAAAPASAPGDAVTLQPPAGP